MGEQIILGKGGTREKIFLAAVRLFSAQTYGCVTMRDIAAQAGIKVASIYNHFASKQELLQAMYDFYAHQQRMAAPNLQKMLALAETAPPREVLMMADFHYPPAVQETMDRILIIAAIEARGSAKSQRFVKEHILDLTNTYIAPVLRRMVTLGRVAPMDVDTFCCLLSNFTFSAALRNHTEHPVTLEEWQSSLAFIFLMIQPC